MSSFVTERLRRYSDKAPSECDLAVVRFSDYKGASGLFPDSNQERIGELIYVVGNPVV